MGHTLDIVRTCETPSDRARGLMFTEIGEHDACLFLFDSRTPLSFWGKNTPQNLWLNCVSDGVVAECLLIESGSMSPVKTDGSYDMAFEALAPYLGERVAVDGTTMKVW